MAKLVIFGAGAVAKLAHYYFERDSEHDVVGFTVDDSYRSSDRYHGLPVVDFSTVRKRFPPDTHRMFIALSYADMNQLRSARYQSAKDLGYELVSYVSSRCSYLSDHEVGDNCFILEDNTIQPFARIGNNVTLWSGNHVGHDSIIEDHCFITSHVVISGFTRVGHHSFVGVNATLRDGITVAPRTLIGASTLIMKDTTPASVHVPARSVVLKQTSDQIDLTAGTGDKVDASAPAVISSSA